jgi:hypothetical protein
MTESTQRTRQVSPTHADGMVRDESGALLAVPSGWVLLPPGDAALTRRVKAAGPVWTMQERKGRKLFSLGMYAPADRIKQLRAALERERRARAEASYALEFQAEVLAFLKFAPRYRALAAEVAQAIAAHATPVGSGTVARTQRISVDRRAEAATIAWLRHATTAYDSMEIARVRGLRREVRRALAAQSRVLLDRYRRGDVIAEGACVLRRALKS